MKQNYDIDDTFLSRWLNNDLTEQELQEFKNSEDYNLYQKIAEKSKLFSVPEFDEEQLFQKIQAKIAKQETKVRKLIPNWAYAVAAMLVVVLGLSYFMNNQTEITCKNGQQLACILPDGSKVQLNGNSSIAFKKEKWLEGNRALELDGEAYFKVKKGSTFSVKTTEGKITVLGTEFNVQTLENYLEVECYEGKVSVKNKKHESVLTPGKAVKFIKNKKEQYNIGILQPKWVTNNYTYNAVPLSVVFKDLINIYNVKLNNVNVDLSQQYSGTLIQNDLEKALKLICLPMKINFEVKEQLVIIKN